MREMPGLLRRAAGLPVLLPEDIRREAGEMILWLKVSADKYELPEAVAETSTELGRMTGKNPLTIRSLVRGKKTVWKRIEVQEEDE